MMGCSPLAVVVVLGVSLSLGASAEEAAEEAAETPPGSTLTLNPEGRYQGVAPGGPGLPPRAPRLPLRKGPHRLTWSGFQVQAGVPTVFLELTSVPDYKIEKRKDALVVTLRNTVIPIRNNRRPLRVEAFDTPVERVESKPHGKDTRVVIHTRGDAPAHKERIEQAAGGFQLLLIEIEK